MQIAIFKGDTMDGSAFSLKNVLGPEKLLEKRLLKESDRKKGNDGDVAKVAESYKGKKEHRA